MSSIAQYTLVLIVYLVLMMGFGIWSGKKNKSGEEYFIAKNKVKAPAIGLSFSATQLSGASYMSNVGVIATMGYCYLPAQISPATAPWFTFTLVGNRITKIAAKLKSATMVDIFKARYGNMFAGIATVLIVLGCLPNLAGQTQAAATTFKAILGLDYITGLIIFSVVVVLYTWIGGMFAVAWMDFVQALLMLLGYAIMAPVVLSACGGFVNMQASYAQVNPKAFQMLELRPLIWVLSGFLYWGFFQIGGAPQCMTRFMMTDDKKTLNRALCWSSLCNVLIFIGIYIISIGAGVLMAGEKSIDNVFAVLIDRHLPPMIGGVVIAAALGAMMSTIDSILLMLGSIVVNNIYIDMLGKECDEQKSLKIGRLTTVILGVIAFIIAIDPPDAVVWMITMGFGFMAAAFTFPLLVGIWWPRVTSRVAIASAISGALSCVLWYVLSYLMYGNLNAFVLGFWPGVLGSLVSLVVLIVGSLLDTTPLPDDVIDIFFGDESEVVLPVA